MLTNRYYFVQQAYNLRNIKFSFNVSTLKVKHWTFSNDYGSYSSRTGMTNADKGIVLHIRGHFIERLHIRFQKLN